MTPSWLTNPFAIAWKAKNDAKRISLEQDLKEIDEAEQRLSEEGEWIDK